MWNLRLLVAIQTDSLSSVRTDFSFLHLLTKPNRSILDLPLWHATNHDLHRNAHFHSFVVLSSVPTKSQNYVIKRMTHLMNFTYSSWRTNCKIIFFFELRSFFQFLKGPKNRDTARDSKFVMVIGFFLVCNQINQKASK